MTSNNEHPFVVHPSFSRKETCRLCLAEVQAKKEVIESSTAPAKEKQKRLKSCDDQLKRMYWEISKKASERNRHLCYCRHADARVKEKARRIQGIETAPQPGPSAVALPTFKKKEASSLEITSTASTRPPAAPEAPANSPKRKRASRTVAGRVESYRDPSEDEGLEGEAPSKPPPMKTKVRVEKQESSHSSDSDSDSHKDFNDNFAPSTTSSSSRSRSRSTTGTPLSAHQFTSTFSRLSTKASPVYPTTSPAPSSSTARSQSLPHDREEALLIDRIEHCVSSMLRECRLPEDTIDDGTSVQKPKKSKFEDQKPNIPQIIYKLQGALAAVKELAAEAKDSTDVTKAGSIGLQHLQTRMDELQEVQGVKPAPSKGATPSRTLSSGDDAMWARLEQEVEMDEKLAKRKARAARGYSPSQPYYEDSDEEIQVL